MGVVLKLWWHTDEIRLSTQKVQGMASMATTSGSILILILLVHILPSPAIGIDCFKCVSVNGTNPSCEDPFHNNYTASLLERPCMGGRKGRNGLFPASACIKLSGRFADGSGTIMVRGCALDSGTLTTDTEIIRMSHCGHFYFNDKYVHGCVQSCDDAEACNLSRPVFTNAPTTLIFVSTIILQIFFSKWRPHVFILL